MKVIQLQAIAGPQMECLEDHQLQKMNATDENLNTSNRRTSNCIMKIMQLLEENVKYANEETGPTIMKIMQPPMGANMPVPPNNEDMMQLLSK